MRDVFDVLKDDHTAVESMFAQLENTPSALLHSGHRSERARLVERLIIEESKHEAVEEEYFWPAVRSLVDGGDELAEHAIRQEVEGKKVLARLESAKPDDPEFERLLHDFIGDAREHVAYEEEQVWPRLRSHITVQQAQELGEAIAEAKDRAPTRPHPHTPPKPGVLKAAGAAVAKADRARDQVSGRGKQR